MLIDVGNALACACCVCSWGEKCTDFPGSLALALGHVHTLDVVYVRGGRSALIFGGLLALALGHIHTSYIVYVHGG